MKTQAKEIYKKLTWLLLGILLAFNDNSSFCFALITGHAPSLGRRVVFSSPSHHNIRPSRGGLSNSSTETKRSSGRSYSERPHLYSSNKNNNSFDVSKPTFDLLSFRLVRNDALLRYNSLNQSEPLRINLYLFAIVTLLGYPLWCESVLGETASLPSLLGAGTMGLGSCALFWRERTRRSNQIRRMEKELNAERLQVRLPVSRAWEDRFSSSRSSSRLKELRGKRRVLAIRGSANALKGAFLPLCVLRRRLLQSQTIVVVVPTDASQRHDWGWPNDVGDAMWLAEPLNVEGQDGWLEYFRDLLGDDDDLEVASSPGEDQKLAWFALNFKGRSIASGAGEPPKILELLGQQLQPMEILDENDEAESNEEPSFGQILERQKQFYHVLTGGGDDLAMKSIFKKSPAVEVDEVVTGGGRIDGWNICLEAGSRPAGMTISGSDVWIVSDELAYSTCVEFPPTAGIDTATLLAVQRWSLEKGDDESSEWKLELHQTIPWSPGSRAGGTLRCDCRGCVALARAPERRTFGGLIG